MVRLAAMRSFVRTVTSSFTRGGHGDRHQGLDDLEARRRPRGRLLASSFNAVPQGNLKLTAPTAFGRLHVVPHLAAFLARHPDISIDATLTDARHGTIETGLDLAVPPGPLPGSAPVARKLARHERIACAARPTPPRGRSRARRTWPAPQR